MPTPAPRDLKTLIRDLRATQARANIDMEAVPWQTKSSMQNAKMEAIERLVGLKAEFGRRVRSNTLGILVFGDPARVAAFCAIAEEEANVQQVNAASIYQRLAQRIEPCFGTGREFGPTQLQFLIEGLKTICGEMGIKPVAPGISEVVTPQNQAETVAYIRRLIQSAVGNDLLRVFVDQKINEAALNTEFDGWLFPVAVTGLERDEAAQLGGLFTNVVSVEVGTSEGGEVNKEYVLKTLNSFESKLKGN